MDNYQRQAVQARDAFLKYDHAALAQKLRLTLDGPWLETALFGQPYRIHTATGAMEKQEADRWVDASGFNETMTLLDLVCDSRQDRHISGKYKNMADFGLMFHRQLLEQDPWAQAFQDRLPQFHRACQALGAETFPQGDASYRFLIFEDLPVVVQLWLGDDEFPPNLRFLWDENALMYLKYETMYFAKGLLLRKIQRIMDSAS